MRTKATLLLEALEDRNLMTIFGVPWPDPHLTLSFEPDGTTVGGQKSNLFASLNSNMPTSVWQKQILKAFQTWAVQTNVDIGLVADGGLPNGTPGGPQGDSRFGDVRIGGVAQPGADNLADSSPFGILAGTWAGDSILNTSKAFNVGGGIGSFDLNSIYLHEAGLVLGLDDSSLLASVMYPTYQGKRAGLDGSDIASIQALYGKRQPDKYEWPYVGNDYLLTASPISVSSSGTAIQADVGSLQDADFYKLTGLKAGTSVAIRLETMGLSLLQGRVTLYKNGSAIASASAADINQNQKLVISSVDPTAVYSVRVDSAATDVFGIGRYQLVVKPCTASDPQGNGAVTGSSSSGNSGQSGTINLSSQSNAAGYAASYNGTIATRTEVDTFKLEGAKSNSGGSTMTVMVWTTGQQRLDPTISITDQKGQSVAAQVLSNQAGMFVVQIDSVQSNSYYIKVAAADTQGANAVGSYFLGVQFDSPAPDQTTLASAKLTSQDSLRFMQFNVADTRLFHFDVAATGTDSGNAVDMLIYNSKNQVIASIVAASGQTTTRNLRLTPGQYVITFVGIRLNGQALSSKGVSYRLNTLILSGPADPNADGDPTDPTSSSTSSPPVSYINPYLWALIAYYGYYDPSLALPAGVPVNWDLII